MCRYIPARATLPVFVTVISRSTGTPGTMPLIPIASATLGDVFDNASETDADETGTGMFLIGTWGAENALASPKNPAARTNPVAVAKSKRFISRHTPHIAHRRPGT
jgi:hypothetical protein